MVIENTHSFLILFHLIKVVKLRIFVEEERGQRVYVGIHYTTQRLFGLVLQSFSRDIVWDFEDVHTDAIPMKIFLKILNRKLS